MVVLFSVGNDFLRYYILSIIKRKGFFSLIFLLLFFGLPVFAQNPIQIENSLSGNPSSEWDIVEAGDLTIQGFATDISVNKGTSAGFKINVTGPATTYSIKIYRLGYYQGNGARLIDDLGSFTGVTQPAPITDVATGLVDCGNWSESATWAVPATAVSGVYIARLTRNDNLGASHIIFVVRDDNTYSDMLFKTSDATWQAYNVYGGNSLYVGTTPGYSAGHAVKVSYNRPFLSRAGGGGSSPSEDWVFNAEYPMIRWMERNGYDVSYTTDVDMERDPAPITPANHKVLLSVGHDEYWSLNERTKFEAARNAGVHLAFFSGNEVYWKTRWENSIDGSGTPYKTLVCYKEGTLGENVCNGECDPTTIWTGLWRDGCAAVGATDGCQPENALTGQISWGGGSTSIIVPSTYKNFRFWRNTSVAALSTGQSVTLPLGTLGYEWDFEQAAYSSSNPAGRITLSNTTAVGKTHKISLYRHSSGALVFGAGTVQWSWGLDSEHDRGNLPPSVTMQQATVNLFADMDVQPATLQAGLVPATASGDNIAPSASINVPPTGTTVQANAFLTFSGTATDAGGGVVAGVEISTDGGLTWKTATGTSPWSFSWKPTVEATYTIIARAFDDAGNIESGSNALNTITIIVSGIAPVVCPCNIFDETESEQAATSPLNNDGPQGGTTGIEVGARFRTTENGFITGLRFYKAFGNNGTHIGQLWTSAGTLLAQVTFTNETASGWQKMSLSTPVAVTAGTTYIVSYFSPQGYYSDATGYFTTTEANGPVLKLADGFDGPNGLYLYTDSPDFPTNTFASSNYWVDVIFNQTTSCTLTGIVSQSGPICAGQEINLKLDATAGLEPYTLWINEQPISNIVENLQFGSGVIAGAIGSSNAIRFSQITDAVGNICFQNNPDLQTLSLLTICSILPVSLFDFNLQAKENEVFLSWITSGENNNRGFDIERSTDGYNWNKAGFVKGIGNSQVNQKYQFVDPNLRPGKYFYRLKQMDFDNQFTYSKVIIATISGSIVYALDQNYPNPAHQSTSFGYSLPVRTMVNISLYDMQGRLVKSLVNETKNAGSHTYTLGTDNLTKGIYYYKMQTADFSTTRRLIVQ
jgi:hypothetical protein